MRQRPTSVTVISWILIVQGIGGLIANIAAMNNPMVKELASRSPIPISVQYVIAYVGVFIHLLSGFVMLLGKNWGRLMYVGWFICAFVFGIATSPMKTMIIPGVVIFGVIVFFLFRPKVNEYFQQKEVQGEIQSK